MPRVYDAFLASGAVVQLTSAAAMTFTPPRNSGGSNEGQAHALMIQAITNDVYVTFDGTVPTSSNGLLIKAGLNPLFIPMGSNTTAVKCLPATGTATVNVLWLA